jgi:hypothetical protein
MSDRATGRGAQHTVVAGHMSGNAAYGCAFEATFRGGGLRTDCEDQSEQRYGQNLRFHLEFPRHAVGPCAHRAPLKPGV